MKELLFLVERFLVIEMIIHMNMIMDLICQNILLYNVLLILIKHIQNGKDLRKILLIFMDFVFRINQDLHSWVQDHSEKQPVIIPDSKILTLPSNPIATDSSVVSVQHRSRKVARQTK